MMTESILHEMPGGKALFDWFGRKPRFHDAELLEITFSGGGSGLMRIHAWNMTNEVDARGYFVLDKHAVVILALDGVSLIHCSDFDMAPGIIFELEITKEGEQFRIEWDSSYGVNGFVVAKRMEISLAPGKPGSR
jgi:hypothetical protein